MRQTTTFEIYYLSNFTAKLEQLQRKAKRNNLFVPVVLSHNIEKRTEWVADLCDDVSINAIEIIVDCHIITVEYENLTVDSGAKFIAKLDHNENLVYVVPGETLPSEFLRCEPKCDHCDKTRQRNETFVVLLSSGEYKQIGRNCLALYLELDPATCIEKAEIAADMSTLGDNLNPDDLMQGRVKFEYPLRTVLHVAKYTIDNHGYVPADKSDYGKPATKFVVHETITQVMNKTFKRFIDFEKQTAYINEVVAYMLSFAESTKDYTFNLYNIAKNGYCTYNALGLAVSAINSYENHKTREAAKKTLPATEYSKPVDFKFTKKAPLNGEITGKVQLQPMFFGMREIVNAFFTITDMDGKTYTWKTEAYKFNVGDKVILSGTVKEHREFNGVKQTVLSNCRNYAE